MHFRGWMRPGRASSLLGMVVGGIFVGIGITQAIPKAGLFGVLWTLVAGAIGALSAYNFFSSKGLPMMEVEVESQPAGDFDSRLRKLAQLLADGLITEEEYRQKRAEILRERW